jgi:hypothetical protein
MDRLLPSYGKNWIRWSELSICYRFLSSAVSLWCPRQFRAKNGERKVQYGAITDKEMVDLSQKLNGWTQSVYKFGCAFIHLSALHDYENRDPIGLLSETERSDLITHCRHYHGGPVQDTPTFRDFIPYLPDVLKKISSNLNWYLDELVAGKPPRLD